MLQLIKYIALTRQDLYFKAFRYWFNRNINSFRGAAYKAFNYFINCKVGARAIKLPVSKLEVLIKFSNSIKYSLRYRIVFRPRCSALKITIKLLKSNTSYVFFDNILRAIYIQTLLIVLNRQFNSNTYINKHC